MEPLLITRAIFLNKDEEPARYLVNWAACKADPVHKMGRLVSKNEHYQLLTQYPKGRWVIHKPCLSIFEIDSVL